MNNTILYGRISKDIECKYSQSGVARASFGLAVNRKYATADKNVDFFNITAFGKKAEVLEKYFRKGSRIVIYCHPQQEQYTRRDGTKVDTVSFILDDFDFVDSKQESKIQPEPMPVPNDDFMDVPDGVEDEGLPFN